MTMIRESILFDEKKIKFEINDTYHDVNSACKSRLDLFSLSSTSQYNKILYLDTDIIVKGDLNKVFNVCEEDILYVLEEGSFDMCQNGSSDCWGRTLFEDEIEYKNSTTFTSGILLFKNCQRIQDLFEKIKEDIVKRPYHFDCYDQPYIVYNAFKYNCFDNQLLKEFVINHNESVDRIIYHFCGGPGSYEHKLIKMKRFLSNSKSVAI
jgi:lipopolysaccharide biosynthesis glycosyltransferase